MNARAQQKTLKAIVYKTTNMYVRCGKCKHYKEWFDKKTLQLVAGLVARATKQWEK